MAADPMDGSSGDPQSLNRYAYVENDPINATDPSGLCPTWVSVLQIINPRYAKEFAGHLGYDAADGTYQTCRMTEFIDIGDLNGGFYWAASGVTCQTEAGCIGSGTWRLDFQPIYNGPQNPPSGGKGKALLLILKCASKTANQYSIAGLINVDENAHPVLAAATNGAFGNTFSGIYDTGTHIANTLSATNLHGRSLGLLQVTGDLASGGLSQGIPVAEQFATNPAVIGGVGQATNALLGTTAAGVFGLGKFGLDGLIFLGSAAYCTSKP